jgi:hypothetical protein
MGIWRQEGKVLPPNESKLAPNYGSWIEWNQLDFVLENSGTQLGPGRNYLLPTQGMP